MSIKSKVLAAAATVTLVGGVSAVGLMPAHASTDSCGKGCFTTYGQEYGTPFVLDVLRQGEKAGQPIILFRASNSDPAEDFTILDQDTVAGYFAAGLVSKALNYHYTADEAYEVEYSPYGVDSGLCVGTATTPGNGTPVALEPCGTNSGTVWVVDATDGIAGPPAFYPLISGADTNFADPFVLHYPGSAYPTDVPRAQLNTWGLQQYSGGTVYDNEMWDGLLPAPPAPNPIPTITPTGLG